MRTALLVVDVQRSFCAGGTLAVSGGDEVIPQLNRVIDAFEGAKLPIFFTRDWHPQNHISFKSRGGPWPQHCVQGTLGAQFHPDLKLPGEATIISKGMDPNAEAYSGFEGTELKASLRELGVEEVTIGGLTTDYCVRQTSLDALHSGFVVNVLVDCVRAVDVTPGDGARALDEINKEGARLVTSLDEIQRLASTQQ